MALDATPGSPTANSYGTLAEADEYFTNHPAWEDWDGVLLREESLIWATMLLDQYDYIGDRSTDTQALEWPRKSNKVFEVKFAEDEIPTRLKYAQFELALSGFKLGAVIGGGPEIPVSSLKIGSEVEVKYATPSGGEIVDTSVDGTGLKIEVARHLKGLRLPAVLA